MGSNRKAMFDAVYKEHYNSVYHVALRYTGNQHTSEDITHDVFLKYYLYTAASEVESPRKWLLTVGSRLAWNYNKKYYREELLDFTERSEEFIDRGTNPEHVFFEKMWECEVIDSAEVILKALKKKNEKWYDAVTYVYGMARKRQEVADAMGISVMALDGLLKRAKNWIEKKYKFDFNRINSK